ncbi:MAG: nitroreductase [Rhizobiaceae bacterium]
MTISVSEAMARRKSIRAFKNTPVETSMILELLEKASRAPSGGNVQPWRIAVINGGTMDRFRSLMESKLSDNPLENTETPQYRVYPPKLKEPFRTSRFEVGEAMYGLLGISREHRAERLKWFSNNYRFFGAPAAIFCFVDRIMGPPQWSDLGMFLQSFMLLAQEAGLSTCPQECWAAYPETVSNFCDVEPELMLFCGVAIGHAKTEAPVNNLVTRREPLENWTKII